MTVEEVTVMADERWVEWPIPWSAIWVGALAALAMALIFGLAGVALGAHQLGPAQRIVKWSNFGLGALVFSVFGAFLSFSVGGWVGGKIAGVHRSETAMLYGAIVWLLAVPLLLILVALGAGSSLAGWYGGLLGTPVWVTPTNVVVGPDTAAATRNSALGAITALVLGLVGAVIGGWMASGEPMTLSRGTRETTRSSRPAPILNSERGSALLYIVAWLLGVPLTLLIVLWLLGVGR
jgi:hypothetical protein